MPQFKDRQEYERWKAEKLRQASQEGKPLDSTEETKQPSQSSSEVRRSTPASPSGLPPIGELLGCSWDAYKERFGTLVLLCLLMVLFFILPLAVFGGGGFALALLLPDMKAVLIGFFMTVAALVSIYTLFWGMSALLCAVTDDTLTAGGALGRGRARVWGLIWVFGLTGFLTTGGLLLFLVPGVIFLVWFTFGQFVFIEEGERGMRALLKNRELVKGYSLDVFVRLFLIWLVSAVLGIVPFIGPVISFLLVPFVMIFSYQIYKQLKALKGDVAFSATAGEKCKWICTATLGYIMAPVIIIAMMGAFISVPLMTLKGLMSSAMKEMNMPHPGGVIDKEVEKAYLDYRAALMAGDIEGLKKIVAAERAKELEGEQAAVVIERIKAFSPKQVRITGTTVTGDTASASAAAEGGMTGTIQMRREDGRWKLLSESWNKEMNASAQQLRPDLRRPYAYDKIAGTWKGREEGKSSGEWELILGPAFEFSATGPTGEFYRGESMVYDSLGMEGNSIRVLPGGAPFDIRITDATDKSYKGKISLGSYKLMGEVLQICGSEPGLMKRSSDFRSAGGIRCVEFRRISGPLDVPHEAYPSQAQPGQQPSPASGASPFSKQDPNISGQAVLVVDGKTETYPLNSGFFSETRLNNPSRASIQFQASAPDHSNARRIEITLDATMTGTHYADGALLSDNFMDNDKIQIGRATAQGLTASFRWVADGGQIYFPKPSCTIIITSAYSGTASGVFSGEVRDCTVHSAGIDHHISSVRFLLRGASSH